MVAQTRCRTRAKRESSSVVAHKPREKRFPGCDSSLPVCLFVSMMGTLPVVRKDACVRALPLPSIFFGEAGNPTTRGAAVTVAA